MKHSDTAYLFDVDGVLTPVGKDPKIHSLTLIGEIIQLLKKGMVVGFNTGRSSAFITQEVFTPLRDRITEEGLPCSLFAAAEKGAVTLHIDSTGKIHEEINLSLSVPQLIKDLTKELLDTEFSETMFWDDSKEAMASIEYKVGTSFEKFQHDQALLITKLQSMLEAYNCTETLCIDPTIIATDVESSTGGKDVGARAFVNFLKKEDLLPKQFVSFGDSQSDHAMHCALLEKGLSSTFVFVGKPTALDGLSHDHVIFTKELNDLGTLEFLTS